MKNSRRINTVNKTQQKRNYNIGGPENQLAHDKGLSAAEWYASPISRQKLKELMKRKDGPAIRDTLIWFGLLISTGIIAYYSWGTWWAIPAFFVYGTLYSATAEARSHECQHGTAFKTQWLNETIYQIAAFFNLRPATPAYWSHTRHHSDTYIVGLDPEMAARPPMWRMVMINIVRAQSGLSDMKRTLLHFFGKLTPDEKLYMPASNHRKAFREAHVYALILLAVIVWCIIIKSILPAMFIGLPTFYGYFLFILFVLLQHLGLNEDVLDHRLNTRTMYLNPVFRFLYWNMNYHVEHHMFPMVPYHALPALHKEIKADCPQPATSLWSALKVVFQAIQKQRDDYTYSIVPPLPATARPYRFVPAAETKNSLPMD
jgi:fatty acid desaturase